MKFLIIFFLSWNFFAQTPGEKILSKFQCAEGAETAQINSEMNKLKNLANELKTNDSQCSGFKDAFSNIPEIETLIDTHFNNSYVNEIKKTEKEIENLEDQLNYISALPIDSPERQWLSSEAIIEASIIQARGKIISFRNQLGNDKIDLEITNASERIYEVERYFDNLSSAIEANCFKNNEGVATNALSSMAGIAGMFTNSPWGTAAIVGSKLISKIVSIGGKIFKAKRKNKIDNLVEPIKVMNGVECAIKSFSQGQCHLLNKSRVYSLVADKGSELGDNCYTGVVDMDEIQGLYDQTSQVLSQYRSSINNLNSGDARSDENNTLRARFDSAQVSFKGRVNAGLRKFQEALSKNEEDLVVSKAKLASSNFNAIDSFLKSVRNSRIERNKPDLFNNGFITTLFPDSESEEVVEQLKNMYLDEMKKDYEEQRGSLNGFNPDRYLRNSNSSDIFLALYDEFSIPVSDDNSDGRGAYSAGILKNETPEIIKNINNKLSSSNALEEFENNLDGFVNSYKEELPVKSSQIGDIERTNTIELFSSSKGRVDEYSPLESMDKLLTIGERVVENRELLKSNMANRKNYLKKRNIEIEKTLSEANGITDNRVKNLNFILKKNKKQIQVFDEDILRMENIGYQELVDAIVSMREAKDQTIEKWEKYQALRGKNRSKAEDAKRLMRGEKVQKEESVSLEEIEAAKSTFVNSVNKYMNFDNSTGTAKNFLVIEKNLAMNNDFWDQQLDNIFNVPKENEDVFFLMRSDIYKDYVTNVNKFHENKKDLDQALSNSTALVKQNSILFTPYLKEIGEELSRVKKLIDKETLGADIPRVKASESDKSYKQAKINEYKEFCLNVLGAATIPSTIIDSCKGLRWIMPNGASISFESVVNSDFESRACMPRMIQDTIEKQRVGL